MATSVPAPIWTPQGFIAPNETTVVAPFTTSVLDGIIADLQTAFGGNLNFSTTSGAPINATPQGQLATSWTAIVGNVNDTFLFYTQQVDPAYSQGRMQDAIGRIYFIERNPALPTSVQALCTGLPGTLIPVGATASAADGNIYICTGSGVIGTNGTVTLSFSCTVVGPIACPAGSLNNVFQSIVGWDAVTNLSDGVVGQFVETRYDFERRRALSVAQNSIGSLPSVLGAVLNVDGVTDAYVTENTDVSARIIGGVTLAPKSLYVAAVGGDSNDIATAIWKKKAPGCAYNGNTSVTVYDSSTGYLPPYPSYQVSYEVPNELGVVMWVSLKTNQYIPGNALSLIQNAVIGAWSGEDGGPRVTIGAEFFASRFYPPIINVGLSVSATPANNWVEIINVKVGSPNTAQCICTGSIGSLVSGSAGGTMTVTAVLSGTLTVGMYVMGSGVLPNTTIVSQLSGTTGGVGVYLVSQFQTATFTTLYGVVINQDSFLVNINQIPVIDPSDIILILVE